MPSGVYKHKRGREHHRWKGGATQGREYFKEYRKRNKIPLLEAKRKYALTERGKKINAECSRRWREKNRKYSGIYSTERARRDPSYRLYKNTASALRFSLKNGLRGLRWADVLGYSVEQLSKHLERQFDDRMTWQNYGRYWHIDHVKPQSVFNYKTSNDLEFKECWALSNLRPLEAHENMRKSNKYIVVT